MESLLWVCGFNNVWLLVGDSLLVVFFFNGFFEVFCWGMRE
jgi:hypothetical protein